MKKKLGPLAVFAGVLIILLAVVGGIGVSKRIHQCDELGGKLGSGFSCIKDGKELK